MANCKKLGIEITEPTVAKYMGKCQDSRRCETTTFSVHLSKNLLLLITPQGTST